MTAQKDTITPLISTLFALSISAFSTADESQSADRFIVKLNDKTVATLSEKASADRNINALKTSLMHSLAQTVGAQAVRIIPQANASAMILTPSQKAELEKNHDVQFIETDPKRYLYSESVPYGITMVQADKVSDSNTGNLTVCVLDTGYTLTHPDLPSNGITGDDGYGEHDTGNWYHDGHGHGTHVSGTILALGGNDEGVVGVNPSGLLGLHAVKVFDDQGNWAYGSDIAAGIYQCADAGAQVTNMSLGGPEFSRVENKAFEDTTAQGMLHVAAAGNSGNSRMSYPASYDTVISVAAVNDRGVRARFSQYNNQVELAAPGVRVHSTMNNHRYAKWSGTSMATPHVAGVAALVWSHFPRCSNKEIRAALGQSAEDKGPSGRDGFYGYGIVKAKDAYDYLKTHGCSDRNEPPSADFSYSTADLQVTFTDMSSDDQGIVSYEWDFGDGATTTEQNPVHIYAEEGSYRVSLTVTDTDGRKSDVTKMIEVRKAPPVCDNLPQWDPLKYYIVGHRVARNGNKYVAIWWSHKADPDIYANVWKKEGPCSD